MESKIDSDTESSLSFSAITGDEAASDAVWKYLYGAYDIFNLLDELMPIGKYSKDLELILIMLYIEGELEWFKMPDKPKLGRYSAKDKSISYDVPVTQKNFFNLSPHSQKEFLIEQMFNAVKAAQKRFSKKDFSIDFDTMLMDLEKVVQIYRNQPLPSN